LNFEDDRIFPLNLQDLTLFSEAYYKLFPDKKSEKVIFFFDEIQIVENWEKYIRRLYDTENCQIFISGSSSKLLSSEIATNLRGRTLTFEVFPLSFKEYLQFNDVKINIYSSKSKSQIVNYFEKYLQYGGFPELLFGNVRFARQTLQEYIDLIVYKDLIERYKITNHYLMRYLVKYCFTNISTLLSFNKLFNDLKSQGIRLSKNTLYNYMQYLEDAYAVFSMPIYSRSVTDQSKNPKKIYSVDIGFKTAISLSLDIGHKFENIVFLQLRKTTKDIFYWKSNQEVDFVSVHNEQLKFINVAYDLSNPNTFKREINGLIEGMKKTNTSEAFLINNEKEDTLLIDNKTIYIIPLWKWLL
ncbi:MAG: ATP-binding protein, partial [Bacteroidota bacterium]|nr:ATP-binding protein [Bacteroidota bacterium]